MKGNQNSEPERLFQGSVPADYPDNEEDRIQQLLRYRILDTEPETAYDDLAAIAAHICGTEISLVSFIDVSRQWLKSTIGIDVIETAREIAFCSHAILQPQVMVIPDTLADERFAHNPLTTGAPHIRFYAGAPLITAGGHALGTLCVIDREPKQLTAEQISALEALARQVVNQLETRLMLQKIQNEVAEREQTEAKLQQSNIDLENRIKKRTELIRYQNRQLERAFENARQAQAQLIDLEKTASLEQLVSSIAYEVNNPLGLIAGNIQRVQAYVADLIALIWLYREQYGEVDDAIAAQIKESELDFISVDVIKKLSAMQKSGDDLLIIFQSLQNFT